MTEWIEFLNLYRVSAQHLVAALLGAAIWRWGGSPERWSIGVFIATMVAPFYLFAWLGLQATGAEPYAVVYTIMDVIAAAMFIAIALKANRNYPLWVAGFQLVALGAHMVKATVDTVSPLAFVILVIGPSYCQLLVLLGGFVRHVLRERRFGTYRDWRQPVVLGSKLPL
ncbi:MAG: hypothetical protein EAY70_07415 [Sphingomonadales bacterium]|nr:MAG: hypothetical protein EAY70_07415 [Sphingomonadales bacterium]